MSHATAWTPAELDIVMQPLVFARSAVCCHNQCGRQSAVFKRSATELASTAEHAGHAAFWPYPMLMKAGLLHHMHVCARMNEVIAAQKEMYEAPYMQ
eukprot:scaffold140231_cov21-Tisochrysis_lutea.AAC.1